MPESSEWKPFDLLDIFPRKEFARNKMVRFYEINPLGEIRYLEPSGKRFRTVKPVIVNGKAWFMANIGASHGAIVVVRFLVSDLVKRYFNS